ILQIWTRGQWLPPPTAASDSASKAVAMAGAPRVGQPKGNPQSTTPPRPRFEGGFFINWEPPPEPVFGLPKASPPPPKTERNCPRKPSGGKPEKLVPRTIKRPAPIGTGCVTNRTSSSSPWNSLARARYQRGSGYWSVRTEADSGLRPSESQTGSTDSRP